jgi:formamidopyrimidine-DNA glycosylase
MPELPEVETMVRDLADRVVDARISGFDLFWPRTLALADVDSARSAIVGLRISAVNRRGKFALFELECGQATLGLHRGMTGSIFFRAVDDPPDRFVRAVIALEDGFELRFDDARKFGRIFLRSSNASSPRLPWLLLGPEPLDRNFTHTVLASRLHGRTGAIKPALLNQAIVAGLGNIYTDEALFRARIHPARPAGSLTPEETKRLVRSIRHVLKSSIEARGTTFSSYRDINGRTGSNRDRLQVFQRTGSACMRCRTEISRIVLGGRSTHFCPACQPLEPLASN